MSIRHFVKENSLFSKKNSLKYLNFIIIIESIVKFYKKGRRIKTGFTNIENTTKHKLQIVINLFAQKKQTRTNKQSGQIDKKTYSINDHRQNFPLIINVIYIHLFVFFGC